MRNFFTFLATLMLLSFVANAQDVITMKNGDEVQSKIMEITPTEIKYKRYENQEGPTYTIKKSDAFMIKYQNGTKDVFNDEPETKTEDNGEFWNPELWTNKYPAGIGVFIDPVGLGFYGVRLGAEFRYRRFDAAIAGHIGSGAILNLTHQNYQGMPDEVEAASCISFNPKFLFPNKNNFAGYVGVLSGFGKYRFKRYSPNKTVKENYVVASFGGGVKFRANSGFYTNISGYWGVYVAPTQDYKYDGDTYFKTDYDGIFAFFGMAEVAIGYEFKVK